MPFTHATPESLLGRCDSKNPATTCNGITTNGRPCRRSLASPKSSPTTPRAGLTNGVVAVTQDASGQLTDAAFYCWQHKEQAEDLSRTEPRAGAHSTLMSVQERTSIDSLAARLGVLSIDQNRQHQRPFTRPQTQKTPMATHTRSHNHIAPLTETGRGRPVNSQPREKRKSGFWASLCCFSQPDENGDYVEIVRHRKRVNRIAEPEMTTTNQQRQAGAQARPTQRTPQQSHAIGVPPVHTTTDRTANRIPLSKLPTQPPNPRLSKSRSQTEHLLSLLPPHLSPRIASSLLAELSKPISPHDEAGYIYIFWLTNTSNLTPSPTTATSLLSPAPPRPTHTHNHDRRLSDVLSSYSSPSSSQPRTIRLKIGRANNVHRRMTQWTRQCGYNLSLVRWYPHVSSTQPSPSISPDRSSPAPIGLYPDLSRQLLAETRREVSSDGGGGVRKVAHAHRVERLVHLELADQQVKHGCATCGKEHREWFEVEASEEGVKAVDEVVKRWVAWAEAAEQ